MGEVQNKFCIGNNSLTTVNELSEQQKILPKKLFLGKSVRDEQIGFGLRQVAAGQLAARTTRCKNT